MAAVSEEDKKIRTKRRVASELFGEAVITKKRYSFKNELVDTSSHNDTMFHYRLMSPTFDASTSILNAYAINRDANMVAFGTTDSRIGDYVFGDNITNNFYKLKYFSSRRGIDAYEMEPVDFFAIASYFHASGRAVLQSGVDFGCNAASGKNQVGARCRAGIGFNWQVPTGTEDPLTLGPVMITVPGIQSQAGIGIGAYLGGSVGFTVHYSFPVSFEADLDISLGGAAAFIFDVPQQVKINDWEPGALCYDIPLEEFGIITYIKICGVKIGITPSVCLNFGVKDITLTLPQALKYSRRVQLTVDKQIQFKTSGIVNHPWQVNFDNTLDSNLDLHGWLDPSNWGLSLTPYAEAYVSLGVYAGSFASVDIDAGVRLDVPSEFAGDRTKCAAPYLYGKFSPAVFAIVKTDGLKIKLPIFGTITLIKAQTLAQVQLAPPDGYVYPRLCLVSQKNGGEGVAQASADEGVTVVKIMKGLSEATGVYNLYLDVLDHADMTKLIDSLPFGQFTLTGTQVPIGRSLMHRHDLLPTAYRFRAVAEGALSPDILIGDPITAETGEALTVKGGGIALEVTFQKALAYDEFREVPISKVGLGAFPATQERGFEYAVIQHGNTTSYQIGPEAQFFDTGSLGVMAPHTGIYKSTLPARVTVRSIKALGAVEAVEVAFYAKALGDGTRTQVAHAAMTAAVEAEGLFPAEALINGLLDPTLNDLVVVVGFGNEAILTSAELLRLAHNTIDGLHTVTVGGVAEVTLVVRGEAPQVALTGLNPDVTWVITAPVYRTPLVAGSSLTLKLPATAAYGVLFLEHGGDASTLIGTENRVILTVSGLTPLVPHSWLNQNQALCTMSEENVVMVNGEKVVAIPFRVTEIDAVEPLQVTVESMFTGRGDCVCRPDLDITGSLGDIFGCIERAQTRGSWRAMADGSNEIVTPTVVVGQDWFLNRFFVRAGAEAQTTIAHIRQTTFEIEEWSPYKTLSSLLPGLPITITCQRASGIGLSLAQSLPWDDATKSATWTPTQQLQTFIVFGAAGTQNALFKIPASSVKDGASAVLTIGDDASLVDVNFDDVGTFAMSGVQRLVLAGRTSDVWLYSQTPTTVAVYDIKPRANLKIEIIYEVQGNVTAIHAEANGQHLPFSWTKLTTVEGVAFVAKALKIDLPDDFTDADIWADPSGLISARTELVQTRISGKSVDKAVFDIPAGSIKSAKVAGRPLLSAGAIAGISIAAGVVVIGAIVAIVIVLRRKRNRAQGEIVMSLTVDEAGAPRGME